MIRDRVLAAWAASPARFREDANAEEDLALGGYRDRLVVELAQNAADAAARAGVPGRLRFTLRDDPQARAESGGPVLVAANTGAPLTAEGVEALATLRASAKREDSLDADARTQSVGRFGVGFAAVLAVTDEPTVLSRPGGARFSRDDTATLVDEVGRTAPGLTEEVRRRGGHVPVLRLPFPAEGEPPEGFETAVVLPLRDEAAADLVRRLLAEADDALLLALPHLARIEIDVDPAAPPRVLADVHTRWHAYRAAGVWSPAERAELLADRPTEERERPYWSVLWALPQVPKGSHTALTPAYDLPTVVHAPTPTDEPLSLPAMLLTSFPLDPTRRHVAPGPLTDRLVAEAATAYAELARTRAEAGDDVMGLVPVGLPLGRLDGALRQEILRRLPGTPLIAAAEDPSMLLRPREAVVVEGADDPLIRMLAPAVGGLVASRRRDRAAFEALGVRRLPLADLVDELAAVAAAHPPGWWHDLYVALASTVADPERREALGALPVPLVDGRVVHGARGLLLPGGGEVPAEALSVLASYGLRLVHPEACAEPALATLERLGAVPASPRTLLDDGAVRAAVEDSVDADDPAGVADGVLALVAAAVAAGELGPGDLPWLGDLAVPDEAGELAPASALVLPGSDAEAVLDAEEFTPADAGLVDRWGTPVLEAVGVVRTLGLVTAFDVDLAGLPDELADLDELTDWADEALSGRLGGPAGGLLGGTVGELSAVRDLDYVRDDAWPAALRLLTSEPSLRRALVQPVRMVDVDRPDGPAVVVPSYTSWWVRQHVRIDGQPLTSFADPEADPVLAALLGSAPPAIANLDPDARRALGLARSVADLDGTGVHHLLRRLADPAVDVPAVTMLRLWAQLGELDPAVAASAPAPDQVRVLAGSGTQVVEAREAIVVDAPMWAQRTDLGGQVLAPARAAETLAELLDLPLASESAAGIVSLGGEPFPVPEAARLLAPQVPDTWWEHDDLLVDDRPVDWWVDGEGRPHAATGEGLARALAWAAGRWEDRHPLAAVLAEPERVAELLLETAYDS